MPQKAKFSKDEIISAAVYIVENSGLSALTARSLGKRLGTSPRPIFTTFESMDDVLNGVFGYANGLYQSYVAEGLNKSPAFKGVGIAYITFAREHPKLFQLLFMKENSGLPDLNSVLGIIEGSYEQILNSITKSYNIDGDFAKRLYLHMWIYSHGIAVLTVNKMCAFEAEEISGMLTEVCKSLILQGLKND